MITTKINYKEFNILREVSPTILLNLKNLGKNNNSKKFRNGDKVLIVDTCIIGDFLSTLPALTYFLLKNNLKADIIVSPPLKSLAEKIFGIENVYVAKSSYERDIENPNKKSENTDVSKNQIIKINYSGILIFRISPQAYDMIKDIKFNKVVNNNLPYLKFLSAIVLNVFFKKNIRQWRDVNYEVLDLLPPKKLPDFDHIFTFKPKDYVFMKKIPELQLKKKNVKNFKRIIIHTGSGWSLKLWSNDKWISLIKRINTLGQFQFIFIGGTQTEKDAFAYIKKHLSFKIYHIMDKVDLKELMLVMRKSNYFIGVDSGPRNLAHLANLRSISLFGPGIKGFMPYNKYDIVIDKSNHKSKIFDYDKSMEKINVDEVYTAFKKILK